jgi:hypothetical protein
MSKTKLLKPRKAGTSQLLKSIAVGKHKLLDPAKVSTVNNLHTLANRLKMKIATRSMPSGKLKVFRLE